MEAPKGTFMAYATAPGAVAGDGEGRNGIYTKSLLEQIKIPGLTIEELFKKVRNHVINSTSEQQVPWESSSLIGNFYFNTAEKNPNTKKNIIPGNGCSQFGSKPFRHEQL